MSWWAAGSSLPWNKPTDIKSLRLHQEHKLKEYYGKGNFWFTFASKEDSLPTLLISSKPGEAVRDEYKKIAAPARADEVIVGTFESKGKAGTGTYEFKVDGASNKAYVERVLKEKNFSILFWSAFTIAQPSAVTFNGTPLMRRKMEDATWDICVWNLTRVLTLKPGEGVLDSAPLPGKWLTAEDGKSRKFVMPGGVTLAEELPIRVQAEGKLVDKARDSALIMQMMRDPVTAIMKEQGEALKQKLIALDSQAAAEKGDKKSATQKALSDAMASFEKQHAAACIAAVHEQWCRYVVNHIEYKQYVFECRVSVAKGAITLTLGVIGTAAGGLAGPVAIIGLIGTIKGALDLANELYGMFRDLDRLAKELDAGLNSVLIKYQSSSKWAVGAAEVFKAFLDELPAGSAIKTMGANTGLMNKDAKSLEKDVKFYTGRVQGLLPKAEETTRQLQQARKEAALVEKELGRWRQAGGKSAKQLENMEAKLVSAEKAVNALFEQVSGNFTSWEAGTKKAAEFTRILEAIKKESPKTAEIIKAALPVFSLVYGVNPANLVGTITSVVSTTATLASGLIDVLKKDKDDADAQTAQKVASLIDNVTFVVGKINTIARLLQST